MIKLTLCAIFLSIALSGAANAEEIDYPKLSETLGHLIVRQVSQAGFPFDLDRVIQGIKNERNGKASPLTEEEYEQAICQLQEQLFMQTAEKNLAQADAFLKENADKAGIQSIDPKLQFFVAHEGTGETIGPDSTPLIHYTGKLIDGTVFASSASIGEPVVLPIKQSIPGFAKGLIGMKEGEKRVLYIHPELAYGLTGQLPPNSLLIFEVEVVKANAMPEEIAQMQDPTATSS
jgi:peptidylprolyl isomerase